MGSLGATSIPSVPGWASLPGPGFRVIGPSRFGYLGSTLPEGGTPADQADAHALLLDHLGVDQPHGLASASGLVLEFARVVTPSA